MNISSNIEWILTVPQQWQLFTNRAYQAQIQTADPGRIYNVPDQPGVVYNFLEDAYEKVAEGGYVVTGAAGEMWPIGRAALSKYDIAPGAITDSPQPVMTRETGTILAGIRIPEERFTVVADYGEQAELQGNRPGIDHGAGDMVLVAVKEINGELTPDFSDAGRIVNGALFDLIYRPI